MSGGNPLEPLLAKYRTLQSELSKLQNSTSQATTLICENELVLKELQLLEDDADVFKLIGPLLVKQELIEVKSNVSKRIEFIKGDMKRLEDQLAKKVKTARIMRDARARPLLVRTALARASLCSLIAHPHPPARAQNAEQNVVKEEIQKLQKGERA